MTSFVYLDTLLRRNGNRPKLIRPLIKIYLSLAIFSLPLPYSSGVASATPETKRHDPEFLHALRPAVRPLRTSRHESEPGTRLVRL